MSVLSFRFWDIFFEVFEALPRQGPGSRACAVRALSLCRGLPAAPAVLDLGCGTGGQTLYLAELLAGNLLAIDNHAPFITRLRANAAARGLENRVAAEIGDMAAPGREPGSFDLVWSEGALYQIGIANALRVCRGMLRPGGCLAFTDAVWRCKNPPPGVKALFDFDYPDMGGVP